MTSTPNVFVHPVSHVAVRQAWFCNRPALTIEAPQEHETRDRRAWRRVPGTTWSPELLALLGAQPSHLNLLSTRFAKHQGLLDHAQQLCEILLSSMLPGISRSYEWAYRVRHSEHDVEPYKSRIRS